MDADPTEIETLLRVMWPHATEQAIREAAADPTSYEHQRAVRLVAYIRTQIEAARRIDLQPIETAPQDGTWILGWAESDSCPYRVSWGRGHRERLAWCTVFRSFTEGYITHWAPLPVVPAAIAALPVEASDG